MVFGSKTLEVTQYLAGRATRTEAVAWSVQSIRFALDGARQHGRDRVPMCDDDLNAQWCAVSYRHV